MVLQDDLGELLHVVDAGVRDLSPEDLAPDAPRRPDVDLLAHLRLAVVHVAEQLRSHVPRAAAVVLARVRHVRVDVLGEALS